MYYMIMILWTVAAVGRFLGLQSNGEICLSGVAAKFFVWQHFVRSQFTDPLKMDFVIPPINHNWNLVIPPP